MRNYLLMGLLACVSGGAMAQNLVNDSIALGASYADHVLYDFNTKSKHNMAKSTWDIGFNTKASRGAAILANYGVDVYIYPNADTAAWSTVLDTTGIATWNKLYNSDLSWDAGAFNVPSTTNQFDYGWGMYTMSNHYLYGHVIYIIKTQSGAYKKLWIKELSTTGQYTFVYADLDGSNETTKTFLKSTYNNQLLAQYSFTTNDFITAPKHSEWTVQFGQYYTEIPMGANVVKYGVNGVLLNSGVKVAKVSNVNIHATVDTNGVSLVEDINTIGYKWKTYVSSTNNYTIEDSVVYVVKDQINNYWKFVLTGFEGSATGKITFATEKLSQETNTVKSINGSGSLLVYPNPATNGVLNLVLDIETPKEGEYFIYNLMGQLVKTATIQPTSAFSNTSVDVSELSTGNYILTVKIDNQVFHNKFSK